MPASGEQHKHAASNPFEETKPHVSEYTAQQIATLQSRLDKQLGPEYISTRPGAGGGKFHYITAEKCINLANEVFGFNGWSSEIKTVAIDFVEEHTNGKISVGLSVTVRVTLRDGTFHEDMGYGQVVNGPGKAAAFEKAKKEGTTDALKRALRHFGNLLGMCIYDKDYLTKVTKIKVAPSKWDAEKLHRHVEYATVKKEVHDDVADSRHDGVSRCTSTGEYDDEFGGVDFDDADFAVGRGEHPDEVALEASVPSEHLDRRTNLGRKGQPPIDQPAKSNPIPKMRPPSDRLQHTSSVPAGPQTPLQNRTTTVVPTLKPVDDQIKHNLDLRSPPVPIVEQQNNPALNVPQSSLMKPPAPNLSSVNGGPRSSPYSPGPPGAKNTNSHEALSSTESTSSVDHEAPVGFFTVKMPMSVQNSSDEVPLKVAPFNPHLESPSIRKTAGIDHSKSKPVGRENLGAPLIALPSKTNNFVNPQADKNRRVGMPVAVGSPLQNRNSYRAPTMKRPAEGSAIQHSRPALSDVTSASNNVPSDGGGDAKRLKTSNVNGVDGKECLVT